MDPIERETEGVTTLLPADALGRAASALTARGGRVTSLESGLSARGGSRFALRVWGVYLPWGRDHLPWRLTVEVRPGDGTARIHIRASSDEGWALARVPKLTRTYEDLLTGLITEVASAARG